MRNWSKKICTSYLENVNFSNFSWRMNEGWNCTAIFASVCVQLSLITRKVTEGNLRNAASMPDTTSTAIHQALYSVFRLWLLFIYILLLEARETFWIYAHSNIFFSSKVHLLCKCCSKDNRFLCTFFKSTCLFMTCKCFIVTCNKNDWRL